MKTDTINRFGSKKTDEKFKILLNLSIMFSGGMFRRQVDKFGIQRG